MRSERSKPGPTNEEASVIGCIEALLPSSCAGGIPGDHMSSDAVLLSTSRACTQCSQNCTVPHCYQKDIVFKGVLSGHVPRSYASATV